MRSRVPWLLVTSVLAIVVLAFVALANGPASAQSPDEKEAAASAAIELSRLEAEENYEALYDRMHPDAKALVPREAVVGWYTNEFGPRGPQPATVVTVLSVPWVWDVTGQMYWDAATVLYQQQFADGSVDRDELHLVQSPSGEWSWFFGRSRAWVDEQISKYASPWTPTPVVADNHDGETERTTDDLQRENDALKTRVAELEASHTATPSPSSGPTVTPTSTPRSTATPTPTATSISEDQNLQTYPKLSDVRELETRPESMISQQFTLSGVVLATDTVSLEVEGSAVRSTLQLVMRAGDGSHHAVAVAIDPVPDGVSEGAEVAVQGEFQGTGLRENGNGIAIEVPFVRGESVTLTQPAPAANDYETYFQPEPDSIDERLDDLRLAGRKIEFTCRVFNLYEQGGRDEPGDYTDTSYDEGMQVYVLAPDTLLMDGTFIGESFVVVADGELSGVYNDSWLKVQGTVVDKSSYYNRDFVILSSPLVRAEQIEVLSGPPPGVKDLMD